MTIHSAVSFLDELMVMTDYSTRDWHLYAVCCLNIAGEMEVFCTAVCGLHVYEVSLADCPVKGGGILRNLRTWIYSRSRFGRMVFVGHRRCCIDSSGRCLAQGNGCAWGNDTHHLFADSAKKPINQISSGTSPYIWRLKWTPWA